MHRNLHHSAVTVNNSLNTPVQCSKTNQSAPQCSDCEQSIIHTNAKHEPSSAEHCVVTEQPTMHTIAMTLH